VLTLAYAAASRSSPSELDRAEVSSSSFRCIATACLPLTRESIGQTVTAASAERMTRPAKYLGLVTSRSRMAALAGSHSVPLDVMPADQSAELLATIIGRERAEAEPAAVTEISRLCGFLPLAIRIAGARLKSRPAWRISWFAERLRDESRRLDMLKAGDLEVRASFALSYQGQNADARRVFRFAGIMTSDFPAWNLAALLDTDTDHAEQLLEELVDAQLVEVIGVDATGLIRYGLHDLLRDFARERLAGSDPAVVRHEALSRLAQEYIDAALTGSAMLQPGVRNAEPRSDPPLVIAVVKEDPQSWFTAERANLISLVRLVHDAGLWQQTWRLTQALTVMLSWRADWRAWEQTHRLALDGTRHAQDENAEAAIRCSLGMLYRELGQYDQAAAMLTAASEAFSRLGDEHQWATALRGLGDTYRYQGLLDEAITAFSAALEVFRNKRDDRSIAGALNGDLPPTRRSPRRGPVHGSVRDGTARPKPWRAGDTAPGHVTSGLPGTR
jgi:tetratricopeptide (TPR) repeat protein